MDDKTAESKVILENYSTNDEKRHGHVVILFSGTEHECRVFLWDFYMSVRHLFAKQLPPEVKVANSRANLYSRFSTNGDDWDVVIKTCPYNAYLDSKLDATFSDFVLRV